MKNWRYFLVVWSEGRRVIEAVYPLPHFLGMRCLCADRNDDGATGEIRLFFSTGTLVLTDQAALRRWNTLVRLRATDQQDPRWIIINCSHHARVRFEGL